MLAFVVLPLAAAALMPLLGRISRRVLPDITANLSLLALLAGSAYFSAHNAGELAVVRPSWFGASIGIAMNLDALSIFLLFTIALVSLGIGLYSIDYIKKYDLKPSYYGLLLLIVAGMNGIVLTNDLFTLYVFLEITAIASYGLITLGMEYEQLEGSFKYLMLSCAATGFILLGISVVFILTGSVAFNDVARSLSMADPAGIKYILIVCSALFIAGFGFKAAIVPFHAWMPDAYNSSPATFPAISSGILVKITGIYAIARIFYNVIGMTQAVSTVLLYLGIISIVAGALIALNQNNLQRMLAYSSISQLGYILAGFALNTPLGIMGALFHLFNHGLFKSLLFLNAGAIERSTGARELDKLGGLAKRMPLTAATSAIASLSTAGVPPLNGFWSKLIIIIALVQSGRYAFSAIAVLASVVTLWYFLVIQRRAFFGKLNEAWKDVKEAPFWMSFSSLLLGILCVIIGIIFPFIIKVLIDPAANVLASGVDYFLK